MPSICVVNRHTGAAFNSCTHLIRVFPSTHWRRLLSHWHCQLSASSPSLCWHHGPHCAGIAALVVLALLTLLRWCCRCLRRGQPCRPRLSICQLNEGKDACESTTQCKYNKGKEACMTRVIMPARQGQQRHCDKGNDTSAMVQAHQINRGNITGAMTVTMPMQREGKEVSTTRMTRLAQ
jgi:hypothetical protein